VVTPPPTDRSARLTVQVLDLHCAGEPLRMVRAGFPEVPDLPVLDRRRWIRDNADHVRRALMFEPRGHSDMYGAILLTPHRQDADVCLLFMHNEGYSTMCGHGTIAVATALIEEGLFPARVPETTIRFEVPAGLVVARATTRRLANGGVGVDSVRFENVPSYLAARSLGVAPDGLELRGAAADTPERDLAFGGAYYGIVDAASSAFAWSESIGAAPRRALEAPGRAATTRPLHRPTPIWLSTSITDRDPRPTAAPATPRSATQQALPTPS
jgi:trans-L-3-hydroxyproline dehydratase